MPTVRLFDQASQFTQADYVCTMPLLLFVQSVCKNEASTRPCPRLVLVCCTALVTRGLETEGLFLEEAPLDLVQFLIGSFQQSKFDANL